MGLALFLVLVAGGFALRRLFGARLLESSVDLNALTWEQFEDYIAAYYQRRNAKVTYRGGGKADGGRLGRLVREVKAARRKANTAAGEVDT